MKVTPERYAAAAADGLTRSEAAERLGVSLSSVTEAAKRHGLQFAPGKPTEADRVKLLWQASADGLTAAEATERVGVSLGRVYELAKKHKIPMKREVACWADVADRCAELAAEGLTLAEAAEKLGVSEQLVRRGARGVGLQFTKGKPGPRGIVKKWEALAAEGLTMQQAADRMGVTLKTAQDAKRRYRLIFADQDSSPGAMQRSSLMAEYGLTSAQADGAILLMQRACMRTADAVATVIRPKARVPLRIPKAEAKRILQQLHGRA